MGALLLFGACAHGDSESHEGAQNLYAGVAFPVARKRFRRNLPPPAFQEGVPFPDLNKDFTGTPYEEAANAVLAEVAENTQDSDWPETPEPGKMRLIEVDLESGVEWELEYDEAEMAAIALAVQALGLTGGSEEHLEPSEEEVEGAAEPEAGPQGWSGTSDNRVKKNITTTYPSTHTDLRKIGTLTWISNLGNNGPIGCSGVMIGRRLVLTAAHCVVTPNLADYPRIFAPRRDNTAKPYGEETAVGFIYPYDWLLAQPDPDDPTCYQNRRPVCAKHDWALLRLPETAFGSTAGQTPLPSSHPGYMGYHVPCTSYINDNAVLYNNGYPQANTGLGAPAEMFDSNGATLLSERWRIYGNVGATTAGDFRDSLSGVPRVWDVGGDWSTGHSGSGVYAAKPCSTGPTNGPYVLGIAVAELCTGLCSPPLARANVARGMASDLVNQISYWRSIYP